MTYPDPQCDKPPQAIEAEEAALGAILKNPDALNELVDIIKTPEQFYVPGNQAVYRAVLDLYSKSEPVDVTTVSTVLRDTGDFDRAGGAVRLVQLVERVASTAHIKTWARAIVDKSALRRLIGLCAKIIQQCYGSEQSVSEILDAAESSIFGIAEGSSSRVVRVGDILPTTLREIDDYQTGKAQKRRVMTGIVDLDRWYLHGLEQGTVTVLAGRPSSGKTQLAMQIAEYIAKEIGRTVIFVTLEMSRFQLNMRLLCSVAGVDKELIKQGRLPASDYEKIAKHQGRLARMPFYIDDSPDVTPLQLRATARRAKAKYEMALMVIDYTQLVSAPGKESRQTEVAYVSRQTKIIAKECEIPVLALSQLNRMSEQRADREPRLSDLRESGAIEQDADNVLFTHHEEQSKRSLIIVGKNRDGRCGRIPMTFVNGRWEAIETRRNESINSR